MDTKAFKDALANFARENEEEYYGLDKDSARELIFTTEQLLDDNERLHGDMEAAKVSIAAWKNLEADFETLKGNYLQLQTENERLQERVNHFTRCADSNRKALWERNAEVAQLQADKAVAVEALEKLKQATRRFGNDLDAIVVIKFVNAITKRIESGEKG